MRLRVGICRQVDTWTRDAAIKLEAQMLGGPEVCTLVDPSISWPVGKSAAKPRGYKWAG